MKSYTAKIPLRDAINQGMEIAIGDEILYRDVPFRFLAVIDNNTIKVAFHSQRGTHPADLDFCYVNRTAVLVSDIATQLEEASNAQHDNDFEPIRKLIAELKQI